MTERNTYTKKHTTYGGKIYASDFNTEYCDFEGSHIGRILSDWKFDESCLQNLKNRENNLERKEGKLS